MTARKRRSSEPARRSKRARTPRRGDPKQLTIFDGRHGGPRENSGPKPRPGSGVPHDARERFGKKPVEITCKLRRGLPWLRSPRERETLQAVLRGCRVREGFRLVHVSLQGDHLHLIVEAVDRDALTAAMRSLTTRIAKALNKLWRRKGKVFADRFHDRVLRNPWEVFNALRYVLTNGRKHRTWLGRGPDPCSSGIAWDGWDDWTPRPGATCDHVVPAKTWLLKVGWWKHHGRFKTSDVPTSAAKPLPYAQLRKAERQRRRRHAAG